MIHSLGRGIHASFQTVFTARLVEHRARRPRTCGPGGTRRRGRPEGQEIIARNFYRPIDAQVAAKYQKAFPKLNLVTIKDFGGWASAQKVHFADGGVFDQIYKPTN